MTYPHACFTFGVLAGLSLALVLASLFGWAFIALVEGQDWTAQAGRVIAGWRTRVIAEWRIRR